MTIRRMRISRCIPKATDTHSQYVILHAFPLQQWCRVRLKCDGTRAETRFRLSAKLTSPFKSAGRSVQSTAGSRVVHISGSNAGYTMFRGSVKSTGYPLHSPVSPSLPLSPCPITFQLDSNTDMDDRYKEPEYQDHCLLKCDPVWTDRYRGSFWFLLLRWYFCCLCTNGASKLRKSR